MAQAMIMRRGGGAVIRGLPIYTYTGTSVLVDDGNGNWRLRLLTSGILTVSDFGTGEGTIDLFLVGGGNGGGNGGSGYYGAGGGGGYTATHAGVIANANTGYQIAIGAGGSPGGLGSVSSAFGYQTTTAGTTAAGTAIQHGGSGGGQGGLSSAPAGGNGGSDGSNGGVNASGLAGGTGQGTTTREFGEATGDLYSGGGGGAQNGVGGAGGGGSVPSGEGAAGTTNTGGGGSAGNEINYRTGGAGGSGIVILRNHRL